MPHPTFLDEFLSSRAVHPDVANERGYYFMERQSIDGAVDTSWEDTPELAVFSKGQRKPGIVIPTFGVDGERNGVQLRPRNPEDKKKYLNPPKLTGKRLNVHPRTVQYLGDPSLPLWVTEGVPKADAMVSHGLVAVALLGVGMWDCPDWDGIVLEDRDVYVVFDSDAATNKDVARQQQKLALFLRGRNAKVWITHLPMTDSDDPQKQGVDDWLAALPIERRFSPDVITDLIGLAERFSTVSDEVSREFKIDAKVEELLIVGEAQQRVDTWRFAQAIGDRQILTAEEFVEQPQPTPIMENTIAAEVNLLGGPPGAGKSLLARDWTLHVASGKPWRGCAVIEARPVLWIATEGLHDFRDRWMTQPLWEDAKGNVHVLSNPVNLVAEPDVEWLLRTCANMRPGLVVFDVIYGMGMGDDNGVKDALPVLNSMKRISAEWNAATLALGHPGHNGGRRFRGSSMWRDLAYTEWHLADYRLSCEKSKLADKARLGAGCRIEYPYIHWLDPMENLKDQALREQIVQDDIEAHPHDSIRARSRRLMGVLELSEPQTRRIISRLAGS